MVWYDNDYSSVLRWWVWLCDCRVRDDKLQWRVSQRSQPYIPPARGGHTPSSSTQETAWRIIQEVGGTKEHTWVINPTLIAHFEFSSKSSLIQPPQWNSRKRYFTCKSFLKMYKMYNKNRFMAFRLLFNEWLFIAYSFYCCIFNKVG